MFLKVTQALDCAGMRVDLVCDTLRCFGAYGEKNRCFSAAELWIFGSDGHLHAAVRRTLFAGTEWGESRNLPSKHVNGIFAGFFGWHFTERLSSVFILI